MRRERGGIAYLSGLTFGVFVLLSIQLAVGLIPQLLCHWSWAIVTLFGGALCAFRWARADEAVAHLIFWGLLMVHGLCWLALLLVPFYGVLPGTLWSAFGDHGGEHLAMASLGSVPLLLAPPTLLLLFMWFEREWLVVIYHDFFHAMGGPWFNISYQLLSPLLPLALWTAALRPPVFSDLPQWPGTPAVVVACMVANVRAPHAARRVAHEPRPRRTRAAALLLRPRDQLTVRVSVTRALSRAARPRCSGLQTPPLVYTYLSTRQLRGPAHWFSGGAVLWAIGDGGAGSYY